MTSKVVTWRAGRDGIAHALRSPAAFDAVCGRRAVLERLAWPTTTRCRACVAQLEALPIGG